MTDAEFIVLMLLDGSRRYAFITNPGDATVTAIALATLEVAGTFPIGGKPTALIAVGGR